MSQSVIPIESMTYESYADGKIILYRYGKVRILVFQWDGPISGALKTIVTLDSGDRPDRTVLVSVPGWSTGNRQRIYVTDLGEVGISSGSGGNYSDWFFGQISWVVP